jgi:acylphosphatase
VVYGEVAVVVAGDPKNLEELIYWVCACEAERKAENSAALRTSFVAILLVK